jgi:hypothetical protein
LRQNRYKMRREYGALRYERDSMVQKSAAERLFAIFAIGGAE